MGDEAILKHVSKRDLKSLRRLFNSVDKDKSNSISLYELKKWYMEYGVFISSKKLKILIEDIGWDLGGLKLLTKKDNSLRFETFAICVSGLVDHIHFDDSHLSFWSQPLSYKVDKVGSIILPCLFIIMTLVFTIS